jgi:ribosome biogenesis GTPase / thiamine phosphate phosphatase
LIPMAKKDKKFRTEFRKGHESRVRRSDLTRDYEGDADQLSDLNTSERVSGKGNLTRKRTVVGDASHEEDNGLAVHRSIDSQCLRGRVLRVFGLESEVRLDDGRDFRCAIRRLLKNLSTEQRHVVAAGDHVWIRPEGENAGFIERIEPRRSVLSRTSRGRQHVLVSNVDQLIIVASAAQPALKPNLIDRYFLTAEKMGVRPILCINKIDLVNAADFQPLLGVYSQMGYETICVSATTGEGIPRLRAKLVGLETVFSGQSGVGKSSLLNCIEPNLGLRVNVVSTENEKGKHTTTTAMLIPLSFGGFVVDTPGIRQFQLWDVIPEEVTGFFRDFRPFANNCRFPNCSHTHEIGCAVKDAVADGRLDLRRYDSYCHIHAGDDA